MDMRAKLKALRKKEGLTQVAFCALLGISLSTFKKQETFRTDISSAVLLKITQHPRFQKFTLWLMTDKTCPACGQIGPE